MGTKKRLKRQLDRAHEIRKFEIELYWRRATYFWTLIAAAFVGYFAIQSAKYLKEPDKQILSFLVSNLGLVFSLGWYLINRGSKFWQLNWEIQVDRLEKKLKTELYRLTARRKHGEKWLVGPGIFSVSKINQLTSLYVILIWILLWVWSCVQWCSQVEFPLDILDVPTIVVPILFVGFTVLFWIICLCDGRTNLESTYKYSLKGRTPKKK